MKTAAMPGSNPVRELRNTGVGLRGQHVPHILAGQPAVPWFELLTDNHLAAGGALRFQAEAIAEKYPVALHGVGMSLGSVDPLDMDYVRRVKELAHRLGAVHVSEHIAFAAVGDVNSHDLLPMPWTEESLLHLAERVRRVQHELGERMLLENISTYIEYRDAEFTEAEFLAALCAETECGLLLDINNVYVNAVNHDRDPMEFLDAIPWSTVQEIHLAGHDRRGDLLIDTHGRHVAEPVLELFANVIHRAPGVPVLLEWDTQLPDWEVLWQEAQRIETARQRALRRHAA
jgi:uncharacterized protein (UPF0276 family)